MSGVWGCYPESRDHRTPWGGGVDRHVHPCAVKTCVVRPVFARVVGELRPADQSNVQGPVKQNASSGEQSEAQRPRWKPGQQENPRPENQDSQHMLEQPRGHFPEWSKEGGGKPHE